MTNQELKFGALLDAYRSASDLLPRIYVPSYGRSNPPVLEKCPELAEYTTFVINEEQEQLYREARPDLTYSVVPRGWGGVEGHSIGQARQFIYDESPEDRVLVLDDDLIDCRMIWSKEKPRVSTKTPEGMDESVRVLGGLALFAQVTDEALAETPSAVGSVPQTSILYPSTFWAESETRYRLNHAAMHACYIMDKTRYDQLVGYRLPMDTFGRGDCVGEDTVYTVEALLAGADVVQVPSVLMKFFPSGDTGTVSTIPRNRTAFVNTARYMAGYPKEMFTKRKEIAPGVPHGYNIAFGRFRRENPDRVKSVSW